MKILLLGQTGQVGAELNRRLPELGSVTALARPAIDFLAPDTLRYAIRDAKPDVIVNAAAYTGVDAAESEPDVAYAVNAKAPRVIAEEAAAQSAILVHYSTDYVFDGTRRSPYTEEDSPNPLNVYGRTKLEGEQAVQAAGGRFLVFRSSWVYSERRKNFFKAIQTRAAGGGALRIVDDQIGCPTWAGSIADGTVEAISRVTRAAPTDRPWGVYHMACGGETSWYGFASAFLPSGTEVTPIPTGEYPTPARRPMYSVLDCSRLLKVLGVQLPRWDEALESFMKARACHF